MASVQRAFAQKLSKQHAADVRRNVSGQNTFKPASISGCSSSISLNDLAEPLDYEDFLSSHQLIIERDPLRRMLDFPHNDVEVCTVRRKIRTLSHIVPEEDISELPPRVQGCIRCYTSDWRIVRYCYRQYSSSSGHAIRQNSRLTLLHTIPRQEFEIDNQNQNIDTISTVDTSFKFDCETPTASSSSSSTTTLGGAGSVGGGRQSVVSNSSSSCATDTTLTPRNSWASFDLRNSSSDPLLVELFDRTAPEQLDQLNEARRQECRQEYLFNLYSINNDTNNDFITTIQSSTSSTTSSTGCISSTNNIERRIQADVPVEHQGHRILVKCLMLKFEIEVEPIFASMALYDAKDKKKLSENFYFDMNTEQIKRMLGGHIPYSDVSTMSRSAIFNITNPLSDIFIVIKLEKVLQGDINECIEPYLKDDNKNRDKIKSNAVSMCERLGKYRQPFAWTAISLINVITGVNSLERDSTTTTSSSSGTLNDRDSNSTFSFISSGTNSLERKTSLSQTSSTSSPGDRSSGGGLTEQLRRRATDVGGSLTRRGSLERHQRQQDQIPNYTSEYLAQQLDSFRPITITVSSFFKQENDRLRDEDLYKFLQELKRPCAVMKKLKCIPGILKLDIAPCPEEVKCALTPELHRLNPYPDEKCRPSKEILEFPLREILVPHYNYRNLLYINPKELNFSNRAGSARNIAVRVQLMCGENPENAMENIFGKSSCPEFTNEAYTSISYHNKCPVFYDEIKMKLPALLKDNHHILFTMYHISCQRKANLNTAATTISTEQQTSNVDTPVGYTWLPILRDGQLIKNGEYCLPVMLEPPPSNYSYIPSDVWLPGTKWLDNHKSVFTININIQSTIHTQDQYLEHFLTTLDLFEQGSIHNHHRYYNDHQTNTGTNVGNNVTGNAIEIEVKQSIKQLYLTQTNILIKFLPIVFDILIRLLIKPLTITTNIQQQQQQQSLNVSTIVFETLCHLINNINNYNYNDYEQCDNDNEQHQQQQQYYQQQQQHDHHYGRNPLLISYINYQCNIPHPLKTTTTSSPSKTTAMTRSNSNPDLSNEINKHLFELQQQQQGNLNRGARTLDRTSSMRTPTTTASTNTSTGDDVTIYKRLHEELVLQWVVSSGQTKDLAMSNSWILFELIIKSMGEHLSYTQSLDLQRKLRFTEQFTDDITTLIHTITSEIISKLTTCQTNQQLNQQQYRLAYTLNCSLSFFLFDLLSLMDRGFVLNLIRTYCKQIIAKITSLPDIAYHLIDFKIDFLRIICSHEHYIPINLPFGTPYTQLTSAPVSPNPSIASSISQTSFISNLTGSGGNLHSEQRCNFSELSVDYRQQHFLIGLLLSDLTTILDIQNPQLHSKIIDMLKNLLTSHDLDERYASAECRARVAVLYLPLLTIVMDSLSILYYNNNHNYNIITYNNDHHSSHHDSTSNSINQFVAMAIAGTHNNKGTTTSTVTTNNASTYHQQNRKLQLNAEVTRNLLICFLWVIKNIGQDVLTQWLNELTSSRLQNLLQVLHVCITCFEYKGKKELKRCTQQNYRKTIDIKSRLEDVILGQGSARCEMIQRRNKDKIPIQSSSNDNINNSDKLRWRKEQMIYRSSQIDREQSERITQEYIEMDSLIEGTLSNETSLIILDCIERIVSVIQQTSLIHTQSIYFNNYMSVDQQHTNNIITLLKVLLHGLACNQSTNVLQHMFATQRSLVFKFHNILFDDENELCADLCLLLLRHCGSYMIAVRAQAAASLYLLMRQTFEIGNNFARIKMQVTMSLSSLVGTNARFSEESLRCSLKTILEYAENDLNLQDTTFPEQVRDLVFNLYMILSDTVKMKEFQEDPEMLLDLMYRIAKGYQNSPDLRLTWLANMAQKHMEHNNHSEAAMCLIHSAALVSEYITMQESLTHLPIGAVTFEKISPNVLYESAVSDDVLSPEHEGICLGSHFTEAGLLGLSEHAASSFYTAGMYEAMNDVYRICIPIAEHNRDFKKLANIHGKLHEAYTRIEQLHGKRVFGTYFRVGFYGIKFGDLNQEEFIYKEPTLTKLPEIFSRLENFYAERFGSDNIIIIQDSNIVDVAQLDPQKAYIQITYVEPYFESYELRYRHTHFEKNFNIKRFVYATPFTLSGRPHGELHEQYKRKTILTTAMYFPYVKTRIQVVDRKQIVLTPIEVAIEDIQKKTMELALATQQEPPDTKILQMVLQGCIGTTVNQGPMEMAQVFLSPNKTNNTSSVTTMMVDGGTNTNPSSTSPSTNRTLTKHQNKLRLCFKDFSKKCLDALKKNKNLIGNDQRDYQRELERNYHRFSERLQPLINIHPNHVQHHHHHHRSTSSSTAVNNSNATSATNQNTTPLRW